MYTIIKQNGPVKIKGMIDIRSLYFIMGKDGIIIAPFITNADNATL